MRNLPLKSKGCQLFMSLVYPISLVSYIQYTSTKRPSPSAGLNCKQQEVSGFGYLVFSPGLPPQISLSETNESEDSGRASKLKGRESFHKWAQRCAGSSVYVV